MADNIMQVSSKLNDGRIFVIGGSDYAEFKKNLVDVLGTEGAESLLGVFAASIEGDQSVSMSAAISAASSIGTVVGSAPTEFGGSSSRVCKHGEMTRRTGAGPKGPWKAFMCPSPKGTPDQCEPGWVRRNDPEWNSF